MREKEVEQKLVKAVKLAGGFCLKFTSPGFDGVPDRLVLLPRGRIAFIELKAPGKKPRALQKRRMKFRRLKSHIFWNSIRLIIFRNMISLILH